MEFAAGDGSPSEPQETAIASLVGCNTATVRDRLNEIARYDSDVDLRKAAVQSRTLLDDDQANSLLWKVAFIHRYRARAARHWKSLATGSSRSTCVNRLLKP